MQLTDYIIKDNARLISGTLRPSGRFSVCQIFPKKCKGFKNAPQVQKTSGQLRTVRELDESYQRLLAGGLPVLPGLHEEAPAPPEGIGSSIAVNSNIRSQRGSKGISSRQRDLLCWAANSLERAYQRRNMSFLTLTLPELTQDDLKSVQAHWPEIVNTVLIYLQREFKHVGLVTHIVGCTEIQLERQERTGLSYPHLHLVFRGRFHSRSGWAISPKRFRSIWSRCVSRFLSDRHYSWDSSENVQQVNKSTGGYLAKYISKASGKGGHSGRDTWHPSDWILCSRKLRGLYERLSRKGYDIGITLFALVREWKPSFGFKRPIEIQSEAYGIRKIGDWGWLKGEFIAPTFSELHSA